jgi:hypothetical protein
MLQKQPVKTCMKCKKKKPLELFYKNPKMADGHVNKCIKCVKQAAKDRYYSPEARAKILAYEKSRAQRPERKAMALEYQRKRRKANPGKNAARNAVSNAIRDGRLARMPCEVCGNPKSQGHHSDYRKKLSVTWLCFKHHRENAHNQKVSV